MNYTLQSISRLWIMVTEFFVLIFVLFCILGLFIYVYTYFAYTHGCLVPMRSEDHILWTWSYSCELLVIGAEPK